MLYQGLVLRFYVYEPIVQGCLVAPQPQQLVAVDTPSQSSCGDTMQQKQHQAAGAAAKPPHGRSTIKHRKPSGLSGATAAAAASPTISGVGDSTTCGSTAAAAAEPVLARHSAGFAPRWRRQLAAAATFVVSGLEHELFLWYLLRHWDMRWFCFFALQVSVMGTVRQGQDGGGRGRAQGDFELFLWCLLHHWDMQGFWFFTLQVSTEEGIVQVGTFMLNGARSVLLQGHQWEDSGLAHSACAAVLRAVWGVLLASEG
jgi:hypothetical protein